MTLNDYKSWYQERYGKPPGEKVIESFKKLNGLNTPDVGEEIMFRISPKAEMMFGKEGEI